MQVRTLRRSGEFPWQPLWQSLRPHQWSKSLLVFAPLAAAHRLDDWNALLACSMAFVSFCLMASALYLANDLIDRERDRQHPQKNTRPITTGMLPAPSAIAVALALAGTALGIATLLPGRFLFWLLLYGCLAGAYSLKLKHVIGADLIALTSFYVLRVQAGGSAVLIQPSTWMLAFAACLFLNLALLKRYQDLILWNARDQDWLLSCGQYIDVTTGRLGLLGMISAAAALLVLVMYLFSPTATALYPRIALLWIFPLLLAAWLVWMWRQAAAGGMGDDPVLFALRDRTSQWLLAVMGITVCLGALS